MGPSFESLPLGSPTYLCNKYGKQRVHGWCQPSLKCWAGKLMGFFKPQYRLSKNNRRLGTFSRRLLQSLSVRGWLQLQPWKQSTKTFIHHMWGTGRSDGSYTENSTQASPQGSLAYIGRCWAESVVRLMRVIDGSTEMTMRSSKWNPLQAFPVCRV